MSDNDAAPQSSPHVRFGLELRRSRRARQWSQVELGKRLGYTGAFVSYLERAKRAPTREVAVKADEVFETGQKFYELWRKYTRAALLEGFPEFADAEAKCRRLRTVGLIIVPGLFQTPAYAAALAHAAVRRGPSPRPRQTNESSTWLSVKSCLTRRRHRFSMQCLRRGVCTGLSGGTR